MNNFKDRLLNLSIFNKILIANSLIIVAGAVGGTFLTRVLPQRSPPELIVIFIVVGVILSISVNFLILKAALSPLVNLRDTMDEVYRGNLQARAARAPLGDPTVNRLSEVLNSMLEELSASQKQLKEISGRVLTAQEEERKRVARELHDDTSQALTSLMIELKMLENGDEEDRGARMEQLRAHILQILDDVRRLALELRPSALDELGLVPALRAYIKEYTGKFHIKVELRVAGLKERLADHIEVALYRVVQEALTNVAKHSGATSVNISMSRDDGSAVLTIKDNGRGFAVTEMMKSKERGLGLFGMKERMSTIGGDLEINSAPGRGTKLVAKLTLEGGSW
ncbi:MAG: sensor histidine kinase [Dehalococcoidia bacterium]